MSLEYAVPTTAKPKIDVKSHATLFFLNCLKRTPKSPVIMEEKMTIIPPRLTRKLPRGNPAKSTARPNK